MNGAKNILPLDLLRMGFRNPQIKIPDYPVIYLRRNFLGRVVNVGPAPVLIHNAVKTQNIIIENPAREASAIPTTFGLHTAQVAVAAAGNTNLTPTAVASYLNMQLFLNVPVATIGAGTSWTFINQVQDPISLLWVDSQVLITGVTPALVATWTNNEFYANILTFGVGTQYAMRWTTDLGAGAVSFTLSYVLKFGVAGSPGGLPQDVFIGPNVGVSVTSGHPIQPGQREYLQVEEGTQIWGVSLIVTNVNILELS